MFGRKTKPEQQTNQLPSAPDTPKYRHPKILLIDTKLEVEEKLKLDGYNACSGTFGSAYKVRKSNEFEPVIVNARLPNYTEQEIIIVDLSQQPIIQEPPGEEMLPTGKPDWWAECSLGYIDPRPRIMAGLRHDLDRIYRNGGIFIVFAHTRTRSEFVLASKEHDRRTLSIDKHLHVDNWSFLSTFSGLIITNDHGEEIHPCRGNDPLIKLIAEYLEGTEFSCSFRENSPLFNKFDILATNKFREPVAAKIRPREGTSEGWILILPQISNKPSFLSALIKNVLPEICPDLFPHAQGRQWVQSPDYEIFSVLDKIKEINQIKKEAEDKVRSLEAQIASERSEAAFLYDLIRETGDPLANAVRKALMRIGFREVIDVDEEMKSNGKDANLREDLRIVERSPVLIVDVKGVAGIPADSEALQSQKHAYIYMRENNRTDVKGLTIINHQRLIPALDRVNDTPFREEILHNAEQQDLGLMTGWDLFRLVRNHIQNRWTAEQTTPVLYRTGRIEPVPEHYQYVGKVKQVWREAFSVDIEEGEICEGNQISVELPVDFSEQTIHSIRVDNKQVNCAQAGCEAGISRDAALPKVRKGMRVYQLRTM